MKYYGINTIILDPEQGEECISFTMMWFLFAVSLALGTQTDNTRLDFNVFNYFSTHLETGWDHLLAYIYSDNLNRKYLLIFFMKNYIKPVMANRAK